MTELELQLLVEQLSLHYFHAPFLHKAYFNNRLKTTGGRYLLGTHNIEINKRSYECFGMAELRGIILHELCHYHLHIRGMGYQHRDKDFRMLLKKVGAPRFCSSLDVKEKKRSSTIHIYQCIACKQFYNRKRKMDVSKYRCSKCHGAIQLIKSEKRD